MSRADPVAVVAYFDEQIAQFICSEHTHVGAAQQVERLDVRVSEVVSLPHADQCGLRRPHAERLRSEPVRAAVVRHLQHVDVVELAG